MSTTKLQVPENFEYALVTTEYGNYMVDQDDTVTVDSRAVPALMRSGFTVMGTTRTVGGRHTATSEEAASKCLRINTGLISIDAQIIQVLRSMHVATGDADVMVQGGTVQIAGGVSYSIAAGDVINWVAIGTDQAS